MAAGVASICSWVGIHPLHRQSKEETLHYNTLVLYNTECSHITILSVGYYNTATLYTLDHTIKKYEQIFRGVPLQRYSWSNRKTVPNCAKMLLFGPPNCRARNFWPTLKIWVTNFGHHWTFDDDWLAKWPPTSGPAAQKKTKRKKHQQQNKMAHCLDTHELCLFTYIHQHLSSETQLKAMYELNPIQSCSKPSSQHQQLQNILQHKTRQTYYCHYYCYCYYNYLHCFQCWHWHQEGHEPDKKCCSNTLSFFDENAA